MKKVNEDVSLEETTNVTTPKKPVKKETKKAIVNCPRLNMRKAADVNSDGNITPADYVKIKNYIMNFSKIYW